MTTDDFMPLINYIMLAEDLYDESLIFSLRDAFTGERITSGPAFRLFENLPDEAFYEGDKYFWCIYDKENSFGQYIRAIYTSDHPWNNSVSRLMYYAFDYCFFSKKCNNMANCGALSHDVPIHCIKPGALECQRENCDWHHLTYYTTDLSKVCHNVIYCDNPSEIVCYSPSNCPNIYCKYMHINAPTPTLCRDDDDCLSDSCMYLHTNTMEDRLIKYEKYREQQLRIKKEQNRLKRLAIKKQVNLSALQKPAPKKPVPNSALQKSAPKKPVVVPSTQEPLVIQAKPKGKDKKKTNCRYGKNCTNGKCTFKH